MLGLLVYWFLS